MTPESESPDILSAQEQALKIIESGKASDTMDEGFLRLVAACPDFERARIKMAFAETFKVKFGKSDWTKAVKSFVAPPPPLKVANKSGRNSEYLPEIIISNRQLHEITNDALGALGKANDPPFIFVRAGEVSHVVRDEVGRPSVEQAREAWTRGILSRNARWLKVNQFAELKGAFPPKETVSDILSLDNPPFPPLASVTEVPTLRSDGTILNVPGYDPESSIFFSPSSSLRIFPIPDDPSQTQVAEAKALIEEAIGEFPYADQASRANVFGLLLTPILRPAIMGSTPLAVVDAPQAGTGKSLLIDVLSIITTGRPAAMVPYPYKEEEMSKQIFSSLIAGRQLIAFDNLEGELRSPALALVITAKEFNSRLLGLSADKTVPNMSTWVVTGNNIRPAGDMPRRCYHIRLNAKQAKPYTGREFKHPDLLQWVTANRSELLHALLVIARYWFSCGCPDHVKKKVIGSFEDWNRKIGGIVGQARISGFLDNYATFIEQEDESPAQWEGFLCKLQTVVWTDAKGNETENFSISALMDEINRVGSGMKEHIPADIADCLEQKKNHRIVIGKMFQRRRDRRFGYGSEQLWIERVEDESGDSHKGVAMWKIMTSKVQQQQHEA